MLSSLTLETARNTERITTVMATSRFSRLLSPSASGSPAMFVPSPASLAERAALEARKLESMHVLEQLHEGTRAVLDRGLALLGCGERRVAHCARRVQILRHPAEARG